MTLQQFLLILRARYLVVLSTLVVVIALAAGVTAWLPRQYTANAAVVIDVKSPDPVSGMMLAGMMAPGYMATQIDIINSDRVSQAVVKLLRLDESAPIREQWQAETDGQGQLINWLAALLQKNLDARPARDSNVINIGYTGANPEFASAVANAFAQAYLNVNLDLKLEPARQYASFFTEQSRQMRERMEKAQQAVSSYQQQNGIASVDERLDHETAKLNEISSQITAIQALITDSQSKRQSRNLDTVSDVMQSGLANGLKADIARLEAKLQEGSVSKGKNHPEIQRIEQELATLRDQLTRETSQITTSIDTTFQVNKAREQQLQKAMAEQKARVLALNKERDELNVLRKDIDTTQRAYETFSQRAAMTSVESQNSQTNIALLNPASPPMAASRPRVLVNMVLSVFLGGILGVGLAIVLELLNRRVRSSYDLTEVLDLPVLGSISSANPMLKRPSRKNNRALGFNGAQA